MSRSGSPASCRGSSVAGFFDVVLGQPHARRHEPSAEGLERRVLEVGIDHSRSYSRRLNSPRAKRLLLGQGEPVPEPHDCRGARSVRYPVTRNPSVA